MAKILFMSDFQDEGIEGNLKTLESILGLSNKEEIKSINIAGDLTDYHAYQNIYQKELEKINQEIQQKLKEEKPEIYEKVKEYQKSFQEEFTKTFQENNYRDINSFLQDIQKGKIKLNEENIKNKEEGAYYENLIEDINRKLQEKYLSPENVYKLNEEVYKKQKEIFDKHKDIKITGIAGNNDSKNIYDILGENIKFLNYSTEKEGNLSISGCNYTNFGIENILGEYGIEKQDDLSKLPTNSNIYTFHTPPNFINSYENKDLEGNTINTLDDFIYNKIKSDKPVIVHVGHSGECGIWGLKNNNGTDIYIINTNVNKNKRIYVNVLYEKEIPVGAEVYEYKKAA